MKKEDFIKRAIEKHGKTYSYEKVPETFRGIDRVTITCKEHGDFEQIARNHIGVNKTGCPICGRLKANEKTSQTFEQFVEKGRKKHGDKYEYFKETYVNSHTKTKIYCNTCHRYFYQMPSMHVSKNGCPHCNPMPKPLSHEEFVARTKISHPNLEVLSEYKGKDNYVTVRCKIHDYTYKTTPHRLIAGNNCQKCYNERRGETLRKSIEQILKECREIHGSKYEYPSIDNEYKTSASKITIICPVHGRFKQSMNKHVICRHGCPKCNQSHMERDIMKLLEKYNIRYDYQKRFNWLGQKSLDFYLPEHNIAIECQGEQHFLPRKIFKGEEGLNYNIQRDIAKNLACKENNINLLYIIPKKYIKKSFQKKFLNIYKEENVLIYEDILKDNNILIKRL